MKQASTYTAKIYCGLREGYSSKIHDISEVEKIAQEFSQILLSC